MAMYHKHMFRRHPRGLKFWQIYPLSIIFVFHLFMVAYILSSYMERFVSTEGVGALYTISSALAVLAFLFFSHALKTVGNVKLTLLLVILNILALVTLGATDHRATAIVAFTIFNLINPLLFLNIDIFSEALIGSDENTTGNRRGLTLSLMSLAGVIAPLVMGFLVDGTDNLQIAFYAAAVTLIPFLFVLLFFFSDFKDPRYDIFKIRTSLRAMWKQSYIRNVMFSHFLLQMFFAWTVIYFPLYLYSEMGFAWDQISYIVAFGLFAYVLFEWPIGYVADRWLGEKEIMAMGFLVLAISVSWVSFLDATTIVPWMILLFMTRVGAAMVEATTEIYFFKHSAGDDADTISFFRLLRPLAVIAGSLLGSLSLLYLPFNLIFIVLGLAMVPGIFFTMNLKDTK